MFDQLTSLGHDLRNNLEASLKVTRQACCFGGAPQKFYRASLSDNTLGQERFTDVCRKKRSSRYFFTSVLTRVPDKSLPQDSCPKRLTRVECIFDQMLVLTTLQYGCRWIRRCRVILCRLLCRQPAKDWPMIVSSTRRNLVQLWVRWDLEALR